MTTELKRQLEQMPTTDLIRLAEDTYPASKSTTSLMRDVHEPNHGNHGNHGNYGNHGNNQNYGNHTNHTYSTTSLRNRATSSLVREVNNAPTPGPMMTSPMPVYSQTSMAISLGQCPKNHVYDMDGHGCISVYSHAFANKALSYALSRANQKK